jgi:Resolvase, N terminal domain
MLHSLALCGVQFRSLSEHLDTTTPTGKLTFHVIGALAEFERALPGNLRTTIAEWPQLRFRETREQSYPGLPPSTRSPTRTKRASMMRPSCAPKSLFHHAEALSEPGEPLFQRTEPNSHYSKALADATTRGGMNTICRV